MLLLPLLLRAAGAVEPTPWAIVRGPYVRLARVHARIAAIAPLGCGGLLGVARLAQRVAGHARGHADEHAVVGSDAVRNGAHANVVAALHDAAQHDQVHGGAKVDASRFGHVVRLLVVCDLAGTAVLVAGDNDKGRKGARWCTRSVL